MYYRMISFWKNEINKKVFLAPLRGSLLPVFAVSMLPSFTLQYQHELRKVLRLNYEVIPMYVYYNAVLCRNFWNVLGTDIVSVNAKQLLQVSSPSYCSVKKQFSYRGSKIKVMFTAKNAFPECQTALHCGVGVKVGSARCHRMSYRQ